VQRARDLGHSRIAYVGPAEGAESTVDRWLGFRGAIDGMDFVAHVPAAARPPAETLDTLLASKASVVFFIELADAIKVEQLALQRGISIPGDLSIVVLGNHIRAEDTDTRFTSFSIPREAMGHAAARMLVRRVESQEAVQQVLLPCEPVEGETLGLMTNRTK
jgi:DNA-binding LacI/PurR family transcriptional regulator